MKSLLSKLKIAAMIMLCVAAVAIGGSHFIFGFIKTTLIVILVLSLLFGLVYIKVGFDEKRFKKKYEAFLEKMNGAGFLFYNNRINSIDFVEKAIAPALKSDVKMIPVTRSKIVGDGSDCFGKMLEDVETRNGFPYLAKVIDGNVLTESINSQFYNVMNGKKPIEPLLDRINAFYTPAFSHS